MTSCDDIRISLGALAVSALDVDEERRVREHVAGCPRCAAELAELSETVGLLSAAKLAGPPLAVQPDPRVLERLLTAVAHERRLARLRRFALVVAAAAVGAVLAGTGTLLLANDEPPPPAAAPTPTAEWNGSAGPVALEVELFAKAWGTAVHGVISGVPPGATCSLVAVGLDGSREVAATWTVPRSGYADGTLGFDGGVGLRPHEVSHYEVVTPEGDVLVEASA
ncbi:MAG TPA: zf-HC2 domain-containing protein [Jiangellaceae bacterium]|jgi:hypothetical protein|nr:zf-HC2 domain-containing protein [Jiangellaceae bacterium]